MALNFKFLLAAGAVALSASVASANTVTFDPLAQGDDTISQPGRDNYVSLDLNQDGYNDILLGISDGRFSFGRAFVQALSDQFRFVDGPPVTPVPVEPTPNDNPRDYDDNPFQFVAPYQEVLISDRLYGAGDTIAEADFSTNRFDALFGSTSASFPNLLPEVGDTAYFGFRIEIGESQYQMIDGFLPTGFIGDSQVFFGFLQLSHGSIVIGQAGYTTTPSVSAVIPGGGPSPVPLPAGAVLLLGALGGLGAMRLRRRA
ncbi:hypothetical protein A8B78_13445 [Jannaschia sp. EhC01]|nr:hypothetical protein A8B78_13445 [Jannaschia sp. EhC01]